MNIPNFNIILAFANDASFECCVLPIIIIVVVIIASVYAGFKVNSEQRAMEKESARRSEELQKEFRETLEKQKQRYAETQEKYFESLEQLKSDPTNADLKQNTLQLGREYSEASRQFEGDGKVTIFDEIALMNDINAACAAAGAASSQTVEERLAKLLGLKEKNLISEQEYEEKRLKILDEI